MLALTFFSLLLMSLASKGFADELTLKALGNGQWTIYNSDGQDIGTLGKVGRKDPSSPKQGVTAFGQKAGITLE